LKTLFESEADIEALLADHATLIARADRFYRFDEYTTLTKPTMTEPMVSFRHLIAALRLQSLAAVALHRNGNSADAIELLQRQIESLRHSIQFQDNVIGKMILLAGLNHVLDVLTVVVLQADLIAPRIPPLTGSESEMSVALAREFATVNHSVQRLDRHPNLLSMNRDLPGWIVRMIYKPNMTANAFAQDFMRKIHFASLSPSEFAEEIAKDDSSTLSSVNARNIAGGVMLRIVGHHPEFTDYIARMMDFNAKLMLFNHHLHEKKTLVRADNPYYPGEAPVVTDNSACFRGPLEDSKSMRCLKLGL
jgi:hypothetical protein